MSEERITPRPDPYTPTADFLSPDSVRVERAPGGTLTVHAPGDEWLQVRVAQLFPLTQTERMVAFLSVDDEYLGAVKDFGEMDARSAAIIAEELKQQYFRPAILKIRSLRKRFGLVEMLADTEAGSRLIRFRSARDDIRELGPGRYLLTDATGNRFELPCLDALDTQSQALWHNLV